MKNLEVNKQILLVFNGFTLNQSKNSQVSNPMYTNDHGFSRLARSGPRMSLFRYL